MSIHRITVTLLLAVGLHPLGAQTPSPEDGGAFCQLTGVELLRALEGSWTLDQDPGGILYPIPQPLPDQPPIGVRFTWSEEEGVIHAESADLADGMILFPAAGPEAEVAEEWIALGEDSSLGTGCVWTTTPVVVGTNAYTSLGTEYISWLGIQEYCGWVEDDIEANGDDGWGTGFDMEAFGCYLPQPSEDDFEMEMTLMLRFQTPDYGAGGVFFEGSVVVEGRTYRFGAQAGVTVSRN